MDIVSHGFNIYASGPIGTGKWGIIHKRVQRVALSMPAPRDWCYVHNFLEPSSPVCLSFASGKGREFKQAINHVIQSLRRDLPLAFESHKYLDARAKIVEDRDEKINAFNNLMKNYTDRDFKYSEPASRDVFVYKVVVEKMEGRAYGY